MDRDEMLMRQGAADAAQRTNIGRRDRAAWIGGERRFGAGQGRGGHRPGFLAWLEHVHAVALPQSEQVGEDFGHRDGVGVHQLEDADALGPRG